MCLKSPLLIAAAASEDEDSPQKPPRPNQGGHSEYMNVQTQYKGDFIFKLILLKKKQELDYSGPLFHPFIMTHTSQIQAQLKLLL